MPRFTWSKNFNIFIFRPRFECFFFLIRIELLAIGVVILFSTFFLFNPKKNLYINFWITESMNFVGVCVCMWLICPFWLRIKKRKKINKKTRIATRNKNKDLFIFEMIAWMLVVGPGSWDRKIFHFFPFTARIYYLQNQIQNKKKKHWERQISKKRKTSYINIQPIRASFHFRSSSIWSIVNNSLWLWIDYCCCCCIFILLLDDDVSVSYIFYLVILIGPNLEPEKNFFLWQTPIIFKDLKFFFLVFFSFLKIDF